MALQIGYFQYFFSCILYASVFFVGPLIFLHVRFDRFGDQIKESIYDHENTFDFIVGKLIFILSLLIYGNK